MTLAFGSALTQRMNGTEEANGRKADYTITQTVCGWVVTASRSGRTRWASTAKTRSVAVIMANNYEECGIVPSEYTIPVVAVRAPSQRKSAAPSVAAIVRERSQPAVASVQTQPRYPYVAAYSMCVLAAVSSILSALATVLIIVSLCTSLSR